MSRSSARPVCGCTRRKAATDGDASGENGTAFGTTQLEMQLISLHAGAWHT